MHAGPQITSPQRMQRHAGTWEDRAFPDLVKDPTDLSTAPVPAVVSNHTFGLPNVCASPIVRDSAGARADGVATRSPDDLQ